MARGVLGAPAAMQMTTATHAAPPPTHTLTRRWPFQMCRARPTAVPASRSKGASLATKGPSAPPAPSHQACQGTLRFSLEIRTHLLKRCWISSSVRPWPEMAPSACTRAVLFLKNIIFCKWTIQTMHQEKAECWNLHRHLNEIHPRAVRCIVCSNAFAI